MAYIIAHGTVNGYCKIPSPQSVGIEQNVITDIRAQLDNTPTMLQKRFGYLIQMASNGVWISVVKLLFDGERSGGGAGFFAFSAFLPTNQYIQGSTLRNILDDLMGAYLSKTDGTSTKNIGVDWSFINDASAKLNVQCTLRKKTINTHYQPSDKFAYVDINDNDLDKYLEKPFQPEYGQYKAVFLGSYLQHPNVLSSQTPLSIDLENEEYTIEWRGGGTSSTKWKVSLPSTIRKKDIAQGEYTFSEQYYVPQTVYYRDGQRDDANNIISIAISERKAIEYKLEIVPDVPGIITSLTAITAGIQNPQKSPDNKTLSFYGDQVEMIWKIDICTQKIYRNEKLDIVPIQCVKKLNNTFELKVSPKKLKTISVKIFQEGRNVTNTTKSLLSFYNSKEKQYDEGDPCPNNSLKFSILEEQNFQDVYTIQPRNPNRWNCSIKKQTETDFDITLSDKQNPAYSDKIIHIYVYDEKIGEKGIIVHVKNGQKQQPSLKKEKGNYTYKCDVSIPYDMHRSDLTITTTDGHKLEFESEDSDSITIYGETIFSRLGDWIRQQWLLLLVIVLAIVALVAVGTLIIFCTNVGKRCRKQLFQNENQPTMEVLAGSETSNTTDGLPYYCQYNYLDSTYEAQCLEWNCKKINEAVGRCDSCAEKMKNDDTTAYSAYKKLVWLQKTRNRLDSCKWDALPDYIDENNDNFKSNWGQYANDSIRKFLMKIIQPSNQRNKFEKEKKGTTFANKTFPEVKEMWDKCSTTSSQTKRSAPVGRTRNDKEEIPQNNSGEMQSAGNY